MSKKYLKGGDDALQLVKGHLVTKKDPDLYVFLTMPKDNLNLAGTAWIGTLCGKKSDRISISSYNYNDLFTAEVKYFKS